MRLIILNSKKAVAEKASHLILSEIKNKSKINLGLPTGGTAVTLYKFLVEQVKKNKIDVSKIKTFNIDEYMSLKEEDKNSFHYFMDKNLFEKINIKKENINFPSKENFRIYDSLIKKSGGLDLTILGIGLNGHIAFNEPGSKINSKTRIVKLSKQTLRSNSKFFKRKKMPENAITIGLQTILRSKKIILLAMGKNKAEIIKKAVNSQPTARIPASLLKNHKDATFILDKDSASKLKI